MVHAVHADVEVALDARVAHVADVQDAITIPIKGRTRSVSEGYTKENGVTVINFDKSKEVVCEICSLTLKSMKGLESHKKAKHSDDGTGFYCSECGIMKDTKRQLQKI